MSISSEKGVIKVRHNIHEEKEKGWGETQTSERRGARKANGAKGFTTLHFQNERFDLSSFPFPFVFPKSLPELIENLDLGSNRSRSIPLQVA